MALRKKKKEEEEYLFIYSMFYFLVGLNLSVQAKAKHEMLAKLVLPAFTEHAPRPRERRSTITSSGRTKKDGMFLGK